MRRGEVWWADLAPPAGRRPVVLLSRNSAYGVRNQFIASPVTARVRGLRSEVRLGPEDGVRRPSVVNLDVIYMVDEDQILDRVTELSSERMREIDTALRYALGLD